MEKQIEEVQGMLSEINESIAQLIPSFNETVEQQAEILASKERGEIRKLLKAEQDDKLHVCKKIRLQTEVIVKEIGRTARECAQKIKDEKATELKAIAQRDEQTSNRELDNTREVTRNKTIAELGSVAETEKGQPNLPLSCQPEECATCGKISSLLYYCGACKIIRYCDELCQIADWHRHMNMCLGAEDI